MVLARRRSAPLGAALLTILACAFLFDCKSPLVMSVETMRAQASTPILAIKSASGASVGVGTVVDLGFLGKDTSLDYSLTLVNSGKSELVIDTAKTQLVVTDGTEAGAFAILFLPPSVAAGGSATLSLRFTRGVPGTQKANLTLCTNDLNKPSFSLALQAVSLDATAKDILSFSIKNPEAMGIISGTDITIFVPCDTSNITMLVPEFTTTGSAVSIGTQVQVSGQTVNNFSSPQTYTVTSLDGETTKDYTVKVVKNPAAPTLVPHDSTIEVSWTSVLGATSYEVWYYAANIPSAAVKSGGTVTGTSASITGLSNGTTYYVWIKAGYAGGITSGLGLASAPATANIKYYGWIYGGDSTGVKRYALSPTDGAVSGTGDLVSSDYSSGGGVKFMAIDRNKGILFYAYVRDNNSNPPYMVRSAKIDPSTGALTENAAMETANELLTALEVSPDGRHLYAVNSGLGRGQQIRCWDIDQTSGALSNLRLLDEYGKAYAKSLQGMYIHPTKPLLYVTNCSYNTYMPGIISYSIDPSTGALTYAGYFATPNYPRDIAIAPNSNCFIVSFLQSADAADLNTIGVAAYAIDASGLPVGPKLWDSTLGTTKNIWATVRAMPMPGSTTLDQIVVADHQAANLRAMDSNGDGVNIAVPTSYAIGSAARDASIVTLPGGDTYVFVSNVSAASNSFKVGTSAGSLLNKASTVMGGSYCNYGLFIPW